MSDHDHAEHSAADGDGDDPSSHRERVYAAFADPDRDVDEAVERALQVGVERLDAAVGFSTHIADGVQTIGSVVGEHSPISPGAQCPLEEAYCRRTVEGESPLSVQDAAASELIADEAYATFQLGAYIGCPVVVDGETRGTVCFADASARKRPFSEAEELFVELLARLVGSAIERRTHERELRERNERLAVETERFAGIADASFDVIYRIDDAGRFTYVNSAVERLLGYDPDSLRGESFASFLDESSLEDATAAFEHLRAGETVEGLELTFLTADGDPVVLEVNVRPVSDDSREVLAQGVARDVTARKEREAALRVRDRAIAAADVGITLADATRPDNPITYVNEAFTDLTGYTAEDAIGANCRFLQGPETDPDAVDRLRGAIENCEPVQVELLNYRKDGTPFWNRLTVTPVADDSGTVTHFVGFQSDVTDPVRTERLFELLNRVLRHNLRNDMNVVSGYADMLREGANETAAARIRETASDLIDLSERARQLEQVATREREPTRLDTADLVAEAVADARSAVPEAVAAVDLSVEVATDRDVCAGREVGRALAELVQNAVTHGSPARDDADPPAVSVRAREDGGRVAVSVTDEGPGVPPTEAAVVESGRETALTHGTGLGLWLVNWVVTRYGGSFTLSAGDGGGTVATATLPGIDDGERVAEAARRATTLSQ